MLTRNKQKINYLSIWIIECSPLRSGCNRLRFYSTKNPSGSRPDETRPGPILIALVVVVGTFAECDARTLMDHFYIKRRSGAEETNASSMVQKIRFGGGFFFAIFSTVLTCNYHVDLDLTQLLCFCKILFNFHQNFPTIKQL